VQGGLYLQIKRKLLEILIMWKDQNRKTQGKTEKKVKLKFKIFRKKDIRKYKEKQITCSCMFRLRVH